MERSDLIIIGGGPGGYEAALAASRSGLSVTLINAGHLGGTCLNEGCIPTKCLCKNAEVVDTMRESEKFGLDDFTFTLDYNKVVERKNEVVGQLRDGIAMLMKGAKVNVVEAKAKFKDDRTVMADGRNIPPTTSSSPPAATRAHSP